MLENMRISIQGIWSHKMRSFLTMLGITTFFSYYDEIYNNTL